MTGFQRVCRAKHINRYRILEPLPRDSTEHTLMINLPLRKSGGNVEAPFYLTATLGRVPKLIRSCFHRCLLLLLCSYACRLVRIFVSLVTVCFSASVFPSLCLGTPACLSCWFEGGGFMDFCRDSARSVILSTCVYVSVASPQRCLSLLRMYVSAYVITLVVIFVMHQYTMRVFPLIQ